ncbi:Asp/Glu racemase [Bradyrhizobium sp. IC3069]|nr:Asp/Glu racemase [Bradyrhizobium sp. IC4059]MCA1522863.1 Asp/Glu racemase [Bradyrhizobium sp. IC3069]MCA1529410.1 Asp/Glu racemase [Bradyrhizobium yuanmingense]MCA1550109.1 Asp/Glu racemase [Bradyrhizobium sp. BRP19]
MEREIPAMLRARESVLPERFSFHSARMRMKSVTKDQLAAMDRDSDRCASELSDARVDVLGYACLVAIMAMGKGYHRISQERLHGRTVENGAPAPVVTSAGALVDSLKLMGAKRIAIVAPYLKPLTKLVVDYIESENISVNDFIALEIEDNLAVGARDPLALVDIYKKLDMKGIDTLVLSACVQMPSLAAVPDVEAECGVPVVTAAIATTHQMLTALGLEATLPNAGHLLSGAFAQTAPIN